VCDPIDKPELYLRTAEESGIKIHYVVDTHVHADHISGGRKLAEMTGAKYLLHASSGAGYNFSPVMDGDNLDLGNVQVAILHTPGHTPEHISLFGYRQDSRAGALVLAQRSHSDGWGFGANRVGLKCGTRSTITVRNSPEIEINATIWKCYQEPIRARFVGDP
jgi:hypothetical protein